MMKRIFFSLILAMLLLPLAHGQERYTPKTGDGEFDQVLHDINLKAKADLSLFKKNLSVGFDIAEGKLESLMVAYNLQPADLYMVCEVSKQCGKEVDQVADTYEKEKGRGWGVIAKEMGIRPGSPEFHQLKNNAKGKAGKQKNKNKGNGKGRGRGKGKK